MYIMVVGGDNIETIHYNLYKNGYCINKHVNGRKNSHKICEIPYNTDVVLIFIDFVNHMLCEHIKKETKKMGIRTVYSKRAWSEVQSVLCN